MNDLAQEVIQGLDPAIYETVARAVLGDQRATLASSPSWSEISAPHNDLRTVAILKVSGLARSAGTEADWSAVVKLIDTSVDEGVAAVWINPEIEESVYEHSLFQDDGLPFRSVRCYRLEHPKPTLTVLWLEDLSDADSTPFSIGQLRTLARHVGEFNGFHAINETTLPFKPAEDSYVARWSGSGFSERVERVQQMGHFDEVSRMFRDVPVESAGELFALLDRLAKQSQGLRHSLSFGDCQPANLFSLGSETVAIDWASVTMDPTGVDAGCLIGSGMTWGTGGAEIAKAERDLFAEYLAGLESRGWTGDPKDVRCAYFGQFGTYLMAVCTAITFSSGDSDYAAHIRTFLAKRFETPFEQIPELLAPIVAKFPEYIAEVSQLLE